VADIERERDSALTDIQEAYAPFFASLTSLRTELAEREAFAAKEPPSDKAEKKQFRDAKKVNTERLKIVKREIKLLEKLESEAGEKRTAVTNHADREITLVKDACRELLEICSDSEKAGRFFVVAERAEMEDNEFNLNLPRYVDTFDPEEQIDVGEALQGLTRAESAQQSAMVSLRTLLRLNGAK
jgi:type I restriction enzyme M protein